MLREPASSCCVETLLLRNLTKFSITTTVACARYHICLLFSQYPVAHLALVESDILEQEVDPVPEDVTDELVRPLLQLEKVF